MTRIAPGVHRCAILFTFSFILLLGCSSQPPFPESILETPELYISNGFKLIKTGRAEDAEREFDKALRLDPRNSAAHGGLALVKAYKGDRDQAVLSMKRAASLARSGDEEYLVQVGWIRLHSALRGEGWIYEAENAYSWARSTNKGKADAYYYMGIAYKGAYRIDEARSAFLKVLELRKTLVPEARDELSVLKKIESSKPASELGRRLVVEERITRAEAAALLIHELGILELVPAQGAETSSRKSAADLQEHPLRSSVETVLRLNIRGLNVYGDGTFAPNEIVTRAGFSIMMADVISRAVKDPGLVARHASRASPFADVKGDAPYLGAILVCSEWGSVQAEKDTFNPMGALAGYDAVLFIQKVRGKLNAPKSSFPEIRSLIV